MNVDEIKTKINFAINAVKDVDSEYRLDAFKIIFEYSVKETFSSFVPNIEPSPTLSNMPPSKTIESDIPNRILIDAGITQDELDNILSLSGDTINVTYTFNESDRKNMINFTKCYLLGKFYFFKQEWVKSEEILDALHSVGIEDKSHNFTTFLKSESKIFVKRGSKKNVEFRLSSPFGRKSSLGLLTSLAKHTEIEE